MPAGTAFFEDPDADREPVVHRRWLPPLPLQGRFYFG